MSDEHSALAEKLDKMEAALSGLASSTVDLAKCVDVLRQEFGRSAAQLQRLGLNQEAHKLAGQRRDEALNQISEDLAAIKQALESAAN